MDEKLLVFPVVTVRCVLFFSTMDDLVIRKNQTYSTTSLVVHRAFSTVRVKLFRTVHQNI